MAAYGTLLREPRDLGGPLSPPVLRPVGASGDGHRHAGPAYWKSRAATLWPAGHLMPRRADRLPGCSHGELS